MKLATIVFSLFLFISCKFIKPSKHLQTKQLTAIDLSEDRSILSTKDDEIMVSIVFGSEVEGNWNANGYHL